jgi:hypothetical protein
MSDSSELQMLLARPLSQAEVLGLLKRSGLPEPEHAPTTLGEFAEATGMDPLEAAKALGRERALEFGKRFAIAGTDLDQEWHDLPLAKPDPETEAKRLNEMLERQLQRTASMELHERAAQHWEQPVAEAVYLLEEREPTAAEEAGEWLGALGPHSSYATQQDEPEVTGFEWTTLNKVISVAMVVLVIGFSVAYACSRSPGNPLTR